MALPGISALHSLLITSDASSAGKTLCGGGWTLTKQILLIFFSSFKIIDDWNYFNYFARVDEVDELVELLERAGFDRLNRDAVLVGFAGEFGLETVGRLVTKEHDAALAQTLNGAVEGSRGGAKINDYVHLTVARVFGSVNEDTFVQFLAPLNHVNPLKEKKQ